MLFLSAHIMFVSHQNVINIILILNSCKWNFLSPTNVVLISNPHKLLVSAPFPHLWDCVE